MQSIGTDGKKDGLDKQNFLWRMNSDEQGEPSSARWHSFAFSILFVLVSMVLLLSSFWTHKALVEATLKLLGTIATIILGLFGASQAARGLAMFRSGGVHTAAPNASAFPPSLLSQPALFQPAPSPNSPNSPNTSQTESPTKLQESPKSNDQVPNAIPTLKKLSPPLESPVFDDSAQCAMILGCMRNLPPIKRVEQHTPYTQSCAKIVLLFGFLWWVRGGGKP